MSLEELYFTRMQRVELKDIDKNQRALRWEWDWEAERYGRNTD